MIHKYDSQLPSLRECHLSLASFLQLWLYFTPVHSGVRLFFLSLYLRNHMKSYENINCEKISIALEYCSIIPLY